MAGLELKVPPPVVALICAGTAWAGARLFPQYALPVADAWRFALAGLLFAVGGLFDLAGLLAFRRARTTINPLDPSKSSHLVVDGIYRVTRNPMYVGMAFIVVALCIWIAHPMAVFAPVLFVAYITRWQIMPEERALHAKFGDAFVTYARRVPRWLFV